LTLGGAAARNGTALVRAPAVDDTTPPSMRRTGPPSAAIPRAHVADADLGDARLTQRLG